MKIVRDLIGARVAEELGYSQPRIHQFVKLGMPSEERLDRGSFRRFYNKLECQQWLKDRANMKRGEK